MLPSLVALSFAIPVVLDSSRRDRHGNTGFRLMPPLTSPGSELGSGLVLHLVYLGPSLLVYALAYVTDDLPGLRWIMFLSPILFLLQFVLLVFWPAGVAVLVAEERLIPALARGRVFRMVGDLGMSYGGLAAYVIVSGGFVLFLSNALASAENWGRLLASGVVVWFWLLGLYLVGRALRAMPATE
jgi:hypothetical protein